MKNILCIVCLILIFGCSKKPDDPYRAALKQSNDFLISEVETLKQKLDLKKQDQPHHYDSIFTNAYGTINKQINNLKDRAGYDIVFKKINLLAKERKFDIKFQKLTDGDVDVLKNNLYINLLKLGNYFQFQTNYFFGGTHCGPGYVFTRIKKSLGDSIHLDMRLPNQYDFVTDSILDDKGNKIKFRDTANLTIGTVKYRFSSEKTVVYYGKIFYHNDNGDVLLLKTITDTISSPYFKRYNR